MREEERERQDVDADPSVRPSKLAVSRGKQTDGLRASQAFQGLLVKYQEISGVNPVRSK